MGPVIRTCTQHGEWNGTTPLCECSKSGVDKRWSVELV